MLNAIGLDNFIIFSHSYRKFDAKYEVAGFDLLDQAFGNVST
jgi:hypothetical protein